MKILSLLIMLLLSCSAPAAAGYDYSRYARQWGFCEIGEHCAIGCRSVPAYLRYRGDKDQRWRSIGADECVRLPSFKLMRKLFLPSSGWPHRLGLNTSNWNRRFVIGKANADVLVWITSSDTGPLWVSWWDFREDPC
jgi:hypothetical protein